MHGGTNMWQKFVGWLKKGWEKEKIVLVDKIISEIDKSKPTVKEATLAKIKSMYTEADLTKLTVDEIVSIGTETLYGTVEEVIRRQI